VGTRGRLLTVLSSAFFLCATVFLFTPVQVYLGNITSFSIPLGYHALAGLVLAVVATAAATAALLLPHRGFAACVAVILAAAVGLWIQGNLLVWRYGPMDGRPVAWDSYWVYGAIDGAVWLLLAAGSWRYSRALVSRARAISLSFLIIQTIALGVPAFRTREQHLPERIQIDERGKFELSTKRNILLLIFDELQGDVFSDLLARDPKLKELFDGFVHFPDTVAGASFTEIAVPFLLTGELYDNSVPRSRFLEQAFTRQGISKLLLEQGFDAELYPWEALANDAIYRHKGIASNFKSHVASPGFRKELREYALLLDVALFRQAPHALKRQLYDQGMWGWKELAAGKKAEKRRVAYTDNNPALLELVRESRARLDVPVFKVYHFAGAHIPLHDYGGDGRPVAYNRANYLQVYSHLLALTAQYLTRLKEIGVYDDTLIFVLGDHGSGRTNDLFVSSGPVGRVPREPTPPGLGDDFPLWKARALPLLLAKPFKARGGLRVSHAPASLGDLPRTIAGAAGISHSLPGQGLFDLPEDAVRTRYYASFAWSPKSSEYVQPITLYSVSGPVWLDASWKREKTLAPPAVAR
jgi:hypothetical protein